MPATPPPLDVGVETFVRWRGARRFAVMARATEKGRIIMIRQRTESVTASVDHRADLRRLLEERRNALLAEIHNRVREVREDGAIHGHHLTDPSDTLDADPENDLAFALIQMKSETLDKINEALRQFDDGTYGLCIDCDEEIPGLRLRALPFAVRCRDCQQVLEDASARARQSPQLASAGARRAVDTLV
jgi:DnaK suppressor protein